MVRLYIIKIMATSAIFSQVNCELPNQGNAIAPSTRPDDQHSKSKINHGLDASTNNTSVVEPDPADPGSFEKLDNRTENIRIVRFSQARRQRKQRLFRHSRHRQRFERAWNPSESLGRSPRSLTPAPDTTKSTTTVQTPQDPIQKGVTPSNEVGTFRLSRSTDVASNEISVPNIHTNAIRRRQLHYLGDENELKLRDEADVFKVTSINLQGRFPVIFCILDRDPGNICQGVKRGRYLDQFYYDPETRKCSSFVYNGCGGNANRFSTIWECNEACALRKPPNLT